MTRRARLRHFWILQAILPLLAVPHMMQAQETPKRVIPRGTVVDVAQRPVAGATISLRRGRVTGPPLEVTTTDVAGRFSLPERDDDVFYIAVTSPPLAPARLHVPDELPMKITLRPTVSASVTVRDPEGLPVQGAIVASLWIRTPENPLLWVGLGMDDGLGWDFAPSDVNGRLKLPALPEGALIDVRVMHREWAQGKVENLSVRNGRLGTISLPPGVRTTFELVTEPNTPPIPDGQPVTVSVFAESSNSAASIVRVPYIADGSRIELTSHPGEFDLTLKADGFVITPSFGNNLKSGKFNVEVGQPATTRFLARRTVPMTGRVNLSDGTAVSGAGVYGQFENLSPEGVETGAGPWAYSDYKESDASGQFMLPLVRGRNRLWVSKEGYESEAAYSDVTIEGEQHAVGDIVLLPLPVLKGRVVDDRGQAIGRAIVRLRHSNMAALQPATTDADGKFEIKLPYTPMDVEAQRRVNEIGVAAFVADQPLSGFLSLDLRQRELLDALEIVVMPDPAGQSLLLRDGQRLDAIQAGERDEAKSKYAAGLPGASAPDLAGGTWLNTEARSLAAFRGKYVLLDFWFTGCGPCHADFPSVKLVQQLFADDGVVVIGVHDNSSTAEKVHQHCVAQGLTFPIVVDHPDGRILKTYGELGVRWFPTYVLLGPEGSVLANDAVFSGPSLRSYKLEVIREHVLKQRAAQAESP